jgi:hypothetical protein
VLRSEVAQLVATPACRVDPVTDVVSLIRLDLAAAGDAPHRSARAVICVRPLPYDACVLLEFGI